MIVRAFSRILLAMAVGSAIAAWLRAGDRTSRPKAPRHAPARRARPEWLSGHAPGPDGRLDDDTLADEASELSFPASDPPAYTSSLVLGAPARRRDRSSAKREPAVPAH